MPVFNAYLAISELTKIEKSQLILNCLKINFLSGLKIKEVFTAPWAGAKADFFFFFFTSFIIIYFFIGV